MGGAAACLTWHSVSSVRGGPAHVHTRAHTPPTTQTPPAYTKPGGCKELPPPTSSARDPGTCSGAGCTRQCAAQPCLAVPQVCRSPKPSLLCTTDVPPALGWCLEAPCMRSSLHRASLCHQPGQVSSALLFPHPQILGRGAVQPDVLQQAIRSGEQLFWSHTKVTERQVTGQQCLLSYFNMKRETFQPSSGQGGAATIS